MDREPRLVDSYPIRTHCHLSGVCDRKFGSSSPSWFLIMMTILFVSAVSHTQSRGLDESDTEGNWVESQEEGRKHTKWEFLESLREVTVREAPKWYDLKQDRFLPAVHLSQSMDRRKRPPNLFPWWATCRIDKAASGHDTSLRNTCSEKIGCWEQRSLEGRGWMQHLWRDGARQEQGRKKMCQQFCEYMWCHSARVQINHMFALLAI